MNRKHSFASAYIVLVICGAIMAGLFYLLIVTIQRVPPISAKFDQQVSQARSDALKVALTTTAGLGAAAGLYVTYRRQRTEESNSYREQDRVFTERFTVAANLLAHESAAVRLAGVNSLARLADDSQRDRDTCLNTLCSYLRIPVLLKADTQDADDLPNLASKDNWVDPNEWDVRRSALKLICDRLKYGALTPFSTGTIDLRMAVLIDADFQEANFDGAVDFSGAVFVEEASFDLCRFKLFANFSGALFSRMVSFSGADFKGYVDASDCHFLGSTNFRDTSFSHKPNFDGCDFFKECAFEFQASSPYPSYKRARFRNGIRVDMTIGPSRFGQRMPIVERTTRRFEFQEAYFFGEVFIPFGLSNVSNADLSACRIVGYDQLGYLSGEYPRLGSLDTKWPPQFDPKSLGGGAFYSL